MGVRGRSPTAVRPARPGDSSHGGQCRDWAIPASRRGGFKAGRNTGQVKLAQREEEGIRQRKEVGEGDC